ncbi:MAG: glycoside hydrolase family 32 protein, partial [Gemmatimonadetes bacterium]|nr:glycoside hydrolase family 32 protein [Gemmatimonadota bacterium]NIT66430.1 glycoside hydrolase family 32 protein [Gemmatimonadota bacterium]NIU51905.1 glycoside hydrolase family 32 protein [Gemmatimonadota bacterium]NIW74857.1 glycoside hydrolase family 32 protein [Gemmatimonadota bacterium]NIY35007.1 glycoside hydrolase family 32 protein [Gemmatimonadota bacterium]
LLEAYLNDGRAVCTHVLRTEGRSLTVELFAEGGPSTFRSVNAWKLESIW